jgi:hypothetical protein
VESTERNPNGLNSPRCGRLAPPAAKRRVGRRAHVLPRLRQHAHKSGATHHFHLTYVLSLLRLHEESIGSNCTSAEGNIRIHAWIRKPNLPWRLHPARQHPPTLWQMVQQLSISMVIIKPGTDPLAASRSCDLVLVQSELAADFERTRVSVSSGQRVGLDMSAIKLGSQYSASY